MELCVGRLPKDLEAVAKSALADLDIPLSFDLRRCKKRLATISLLNLASVSLFLKHIATLEGHDINVALERTRFRHLPWWAESIWLPIDFESPNGTIEI